MWLQNFITLEIAFWNIGSQTVILHIIEKRNNKKLIMKILDNLEIPKPAFRWNTTSILYKVWL